MIINAREFNNQELNLKIKESTDIEIELKNVIGERYIGTGVVGKKINIEGIPGNALGAYLNRTEINVKGNCQDAMGDTMNSGKIVVYGNSGDATGYSMRGGEIYIKGNAGYRLGIHMKEYEEQKPLIVVGGSVGDFLGEYQAGGTIIILGLNSTSNCPVGAFCGTGMHGGNVYIRSSIQPRNLPKQVICEELENGLEIKDKLILFSELFGEDIDLLVNSRYYKLSPNANNQYKQLYVNN
ncbi:MAG: glutamate synthase [Clostridium sp.]|uniref:GltB/FmdC/FwdC-like GXGXG domain-containing protein n=1 Tax=Clostridium sp. TaxID=1506 RepID=UPI00302662DE